MEPRVLVVEDVGALRRSFVLALERGGCGVFDAARLDEALEVAAFSQPDVLIADERTIREDPDTFRRLKSHPRLRKLLVIALSAGVKRRQELIDGGVHGVVGKPVKDGHLVSAVRWVLDVYRRQDAVGG
jgi:CheY-like chemotaxis protein